MALITASSETTEFKSFNDDAWYTVCVTMDSEQTLKVRYQNFPEDHDNLFEPTFFESEEQLQDFQERFRPLSKQLQDSECRQLRRGVKVCACHHFSSDDVRFYDAVVDAVIKGDHSFEKAEEVCHCKFVLFWLHGPNAENLTTSTVENICIVQPVKPDPAVDSFLKMTRERLGVISSPSILTPKGVCGLEMVAYRDEGSNTVPMLAYGNDGSKTAPRIGYFERVRKETRRARKSSSKLCLPAVSCDAKRTEDSDLGGKRNVCMILIGNLDRELCPLTVEQFLQRHASVSSRVFIFPSLSWEMYTRGAILLNSETVFQKLCEFLTDPHHIITSSTGRPWVIIDMVAGLKNVKASIGTLIPISQSALQNGKKGTRQSLKIVSSESPEFKIASDLRDMFVEFSDHQERLHKKLALEERRVIAA
ncbi:uncharacterized protein LOC130726632 isoform X2 [Lotus japonicus]|uniref:uncharacterized protein LOC130726632 isoform X2 n=1 Tax=Lotus japonicus TaxID=34305 RepID=UPI00258D3703|nr:uncharacterized protein LOC130726632 isoform X2 [Lotus japonicus]